MGIYVLNRTGRLLKPHHEAHLGGGCLFGEGCFLRAWALIGGNTVSPLLQHFLGVGVHCLGMTGKEWEG